MKQNSSRLTLTWPVFLLMHNIQIMPNQTNQTCQNSYLNYYTNMDIIQDKNFTCMAGHVHACTLKLYLHKLTYSNMYIG